MKTQTIEVHTLLQDNQDGGYTMNVYPTQDALIEDHHDYDEGMSDERREEILSENNPYDDGYIGTDSFEVAIDDDGKVQLVGSMSFHAGQ